MPQCRTCVEIGSQRRPAAESRCAGSPSVTAWPCRWKMAKTHLFMTLSDTRSFVEFLISEFTARFALDQGPTAEPPVYYNANELIGLIEAAEYATGFFVLSPAWSQYPLSTIEVNANDGRHFFAIAQRYGGPALHFVTSCWRRVDEIGCIFPGSLFDYPWYYFRRGSSETFERPDTIKGASSVVQKYLRRNGSRSVCAETTKVGPWILRDAVAAHRGGTWLRQGNWHFKPKG